MSIILKNRKKKFFFKFLKIKLSAKGLLQPLLFAEAVGCSLLWGAEGGGGFLATCLQLSGRGAGEQGCYLARCSLG